MCACMCACVRACVGDVTVLHLHESTVRIWLCLETRFSTLCPTCYSHIPPSPMHCHAPMPCPPPCTATPHALHLPIHCHTPCPPPPSCLILMLPLQRAANMEESQNEQEMLKHEGQVVKYNMYIQVNTCTTCNMS